MRIIACLKYADTYECCKVRITQMPYAVLVAGYVAARRMGDIDLSDSSRQNSLRTLPMTKMFVQIIGF